MCDYMEKNHRPHGYALGMPWGPWTTIFCYTVQMISSKLNMAEAYHSVHSCEKEELNRGAICFVQCWMIEPSAS